MSFLLPLVVAVTVAAPPPKEGGAGGEILVWVPGHAAVVSPTGEVVEKWVGADVPKVLGAVWHPDGKRIVAVPADKIVNHISIGRVVVYGREKKLVGTDQELEKGKVAAGLSRVCGGEQFHVTLSPAVPAAGKFETVVFDPTTGKFAPWKTPAVAGFKVLDVSPDGTWLLARGEPIESDKVHNPVFRIAANDPAKRERINRPMEEFFGSRFDSAGKRVLVEGSVNEGVKIENGQWSWPKGENWVFDTVDVTNGARARVAALKPNEWPGGASCWSPDGRYVAIALRVYSPRIDTLDAVVVRVCEIKTGQVKDVYKIGGWDNAGHDSMNPTLCLDWK